MLSAATIFAAVWLMMMRKQLRIHPAMAIVFAVLHTTYGVLCVKAFAVLEGANSGAMSIFGAVFFMPIAYALGAKIFRLSPANVFDVFTIPLVFTLMLSRCNCLVAGCCLGRFVSGTAHRWPTREAEIVFYLVFLFASVPCVWKEETKGRLFPIYMLSYGAFRALIEFFRVSDSNTLFHLSHIWALLAFSLGFSIYVEVDKRIKSHRYR